MVSLRMLHRSRWRITRLGHVSRTRARYRHKPGGPGFTMIGGDGGGALQCGAVGISSGACQQHDMAARHPADVEPPIVRFGNVQAELVVVRIGTADQNRPTPGQGVVEQACVIVRVSGVRSHFGPSLPQDPTLHAGKLPSPMLPLKPLSGLRVPNAPHHATDGNPTQHSRQGDLRGFLFPIYPHSRQQLSPFRRMGNT